MPKRKRDTLKRQAAQIFLSMQSTMEYIAILYEVFEKTHPKKAEMLKMMCQVEMMNQDAFEKFCIECWALTREKMEAYRR